MPRDLDLERAQSQDLSLTPEASMGTREKEPIPDELFDSEEEEYDENDVLQDVDVVGESAEMLKELHPYAQVLGLADVDSIVELENAAFKEEHRATREKFIYRLTKCGELCLGLFTSAGPDSAQQDAPTASTAKPPDSNEPKRKGILLAHIIATKIEGDIISDDDMALPPNWEEDVNQDSHLGHKQFGRTIAIHSLAVLPTYQKRGLGTILMKSYVQRMVEAETADRISILTYDTLVPYYESLGFVNRGKSKAQFGGGNWVDMVLEFDDIRPRADDVDEEDDDDE